MKFDKVETTAPPRRYIWHTIVQRYIKHFSFTTNQNVSSPKVNIYAHRFMGPYSENVFLVHIFILII